MVDYSLNIGGSEWMIIIFVALVLILGTGKLPGAARKMGKVVSEYNKAKNEIQEQMKGVTEETPKISGPVETEREKLEMIAKSAGVKIEEKTDDELRDDIAAKIGQKRKDEPEKKGQKRKDEPEKK
jgi:sec-independent protein translocase protein TatA